MTGLPGFASPVLLTGKTGGIHPCNVTVYEEGDAAVVTAIDPVAMLGIMKDDPVVCEVAKEAKAKLKRAIDSLKA